MASYLLWTNINQSIIDTEHKTGSGSTDNTVITSTEEDYHEHNTGYFDTEPVEQTKDDNSAQISPDGDSTSINDGDSSTNTNTSDEDSDGTGEAEVDDRIEDLLILIKTPVDEIICLHEESSELPRIDNPTFDTCVDMSLTTPQESRDP